MARRKKGAAAARTKKRHTGRSVLTTHRTAQKATAPPPDAAPEMVTGEQERAAMREQWGLDGFDDVDRTMLRIILERPGITDRELGSYLNLERSRVNRRRNRPSFAKALEESRLDAMAIFVRNQAAAARKLGALINSANEYIAFRSAREHVMPLVRAAAEAGGSDAQAFLRFLEESYQTINGKK